MIVVEHIGIAVRNLDEARKTFSKILDCEPYKEEIVESEGVRTLFFEVGNTKIELLEATRVDSPIAKYIEKNGEGFHHLAFGTDDMESTQNRLSPDFKWINMQAKEGADDKLINFIHPRDTHSLLIEFCAKLK